MSVWLLNIGLNGIESLLWCFSYLFSQQSPSWISKWPPQQLILYRISNTGAVKWPCIHFKRNGKFHLVLIVWTLSFNLNPGRHLRSGRLSQNPRWPPQTLPKMETAITRKLFGVKWCLIHVNRLNLTSENQFRHYFYYKMSPSC